MSGRTRILRWAIPLAVVPVLVLLAYGFRTDPRDIPSPLVGKPASSFKLTAFDGKPVALEALRGQVVIVNFWASWCTECHEEQDALDQIWQRYRDSGVVLLGVNFEDTSDGARDYMHQSGLTYPVVEDKDSKTALAYGIRGIPETFLIDRTGRIVDRIIGRVDADRLASGVEPLLKGGSQ